MLFQTLLKHHFNRNTVVPVKGMPQVSQSPVAG